MDRLLNLLIQNILIPVVDKIPIPYKTIIGILWGAIVFGIDTWVYDLDTLHPLGLEHLSTWLFDLGILLTGVGIFHKAAKDDTLTKKEG